MSEKFKCQYCEKELSKSRLHKHIKQAHPEKVTFEYKCQICGLDCMDLRAIFGHVVRAHKTEMTQEEYYNKYIFGSLKCKYCGEVLPYKRFSGNFCNQQHYETYKRDLEGLNESRCEICGLGYGSIGGIQIHLVKLHKYNDEQLEEYYRKYVLQENEPDGNCKWCGKKLKLVSFSEGFQKFCYNTDCNVRWYNENTDRQKNALKTLTEVYHEHPEKCPTKIEYWLYQGYTPEEAQLKLTERQTTFTKEKCIEKYGEVEGMKRWQERQIKWMDSMPRQSYSMISQELFWMLYDYIKNKFLKIHFATNNKGIKDIDRNREFKVKTKKSYRSLDFYVEDINKCIEFDGTYWHGEVGIGNKTRDQERDIEIVEVLNCDILRIKEKDYKQNKEKVVLACLEFLNDKKNRAD